MCIIIYDETNKLTNRNKARIQMQKKGYIIVFYNVSKRHYICLRDIILYNNVKVLYLLCECSDILNNLPISRCKIYKEDKYGYQ